ncbi:MAG: amidase [Pseudomonadota bacterium]
MNHYHALAEPTGQAFASLIETTAAMARGDASPVQLCKDMLARIETYDDALGSYTFVGAEAALAAAETAEAEIAAGLRRGPLHGAPIAVKDLCMTTDAPTSAGMKIHEAFDAGRDSTVVARLRQAGAVILGKLTMTEGAYAGHHPEMKTPLNPWNAEIWTGASSSGSGAATAAGLCFGSLGSDTGGSIRFPCHACGLSGMKPTWGRVSRAGVFALADSLDHVGPMARSVEDAAAILGVIAGLDSDDPTTVTPPPCDYLAACGAPMAGVRIGFDRATVSAAVAPEIAAALDGALDVLAKLGARITPVALPDETGLDDAWNALCFVEALIAHEKTWPSQSEHYGPQLAAVMTAGEAVSGAELGRAIQRRLTFRGAYARATEEVDMVLLPVMSNTTPLMTDWNRFLSGEAEGGDLGGLLSWTASADMTGDPALTIPAGFDANGGPIGVQLVGKHLGEADLFRVGHAFQTVTDWHLRRPDLSPFAT